MNIQKLINNGVTVLSDTAQKVSRKVSNAATDPMLKASRNGLDALASYNSGIVKNTEVSNVLIEKVKKVLEDILFNQVESFKLSDKEIGFIISQFINQNAKNIDRDIYVNALAFMRFSELDKSVRSKFLNSYAIKRLMEFSDDKSFRFSCFDIPAGEIDILEDFLKDDLIRHYFESYFKKKSKQFSPDPSELVQEFNRIASGLKTGFCSSKDVSMFYDLLEKREYEDIDGLINVILANIQHSSKKELNEFYMVLKKMLEAKTPDGKFIFGTSIVSDTTSKQMLSGIENILDAKRNNFALYEQYLKLLELSEKGVVPPNVLGTLAKKGGISPDFIEVVNKKICGKSQIARFDSMDNAKLEAKLGDMVQIGEKLFYRSKDDLVELSLSPETFERLFPEIETMAMGQGNLGDCYLISAIYDFIKNPNARGKIYQMFSEDGDDIVVKIPDALNYPIRFSKKLLSANDEKKVNGSLGIQMLEDAYSQTRALKYGVANSVTSIEGGNQLDVYNALLGNNNSRIWTTDAAIVRSPEEIDREINVITAQIQEEKSKVKNLHDSEQLLSHLKYLNEQDTIKRISRLEAYQRMLHEEKLSSCNYHTVDDFELLQKLLNTSLDDNLVSIGSSGNDWFDKDKLIHGAHAYSVLNVDRVNQTIDIVNPWNTSQYITISFSEFMKYFSAVNTAKL